MTTIEELGLLKMDFLGLRNLTVIRDALEMIEREHGVRIDFSKMGYDDPKVYEMIASGNTTGVFQLESGGMTQFMKNLKPDCLEDIIAGVALYRPGPMASIPTYIENKKNPENIEYIHPSMEPILSVTYGCLIYQEQVMQTVRDLAGYSYGRSDIMRRAMGKKKMDVMLKEKEYFIHGQTDENGNIIVPGCVRNGVTEDVAEEIYNQMVSFAEYAFNKSHAAAYAVIAYETAYLKAHYPTEFMAALMTSVMGDEAQIAKYIRNCSDMGIQVLPPDVTESEAAFTVRDGKIRFGLLGIKHVGAGAIEAIVKAREEKGVPKDIGTFVNDLEPGQVNKKALECLIKAGALDSINENRAQLLAVYEKILESAQSAAKKNIAGQMSLFQLNADEMENSDSQTIMPDIANFDKKALTAMEKEMLGVYISEHPLREYENVIADIVTVTTDKLMQAARDEEEDENAAVHELPDIYDGMSVTVAGIIDGVKTLIDKNQHQMAFVDMEDMYGAMEVIVFASVYEKYRNLIKEDGIVIIKGRLNFKEGETPKILAETVTDIETVAPADGGRRGEGWRVKIRAEKDQLRQISDILRRHPGDAQVLLYVVGGKVLKAGRELWVDPEGSLIGELEQLVGYGNVKKERKDTEAV